MHPFLVAAAGTLIGHYFQNRTSRKKREAQKFVFQQEQAHELFDELSLAFSKRIYLAFLLFWKIKNDPGSPETAETIKLYRDNLIDYNVKRLSIETRINRTFGAESTRFFVAQVHGYVVGSSETLGFRSLSEILKKAMAKPESISTEMVDTFQKQHLISSNTLEEFFSEISQKIEEGRFGDNRER